MAVSPEDQVFDGTIVRAVVKRDRRFTELFLFFEAQHAKDLLRWIPGGYRPVMSYILTGQRKLGPIEVYERVIESDLSPDEAREYFMGSNLQSLSEVRAKVQVDVSRFPLMSDEEFWSYIAVLKGSAKAPAVRRLATALQREGDDVVARFWLALATKLRALDHPASKVTRRVHGQDFMNSDATLYRRCRIVAAGERDYLAVLNMPGSAKSFGSGPVGEMLLRVPDLAAQPRADGAEVEFVGAPPFESGTNESNWGAPPKYEPTTPMTEEEYIADLQRGIDVLFPGSTSVWDMAKYWGENYGLRFFTGTPGRYVERLVVYRARLVRPSEGAAGQARAQQEARDFVLNRVQDSGETLIGDMELVDSAIGRTASNPFVIERRSDLSLDEYIERYIY